MQVEYATDLVLRSTATLGPLYQHLVRQSALDVKADQVANFFGRQMAALALRALQSGQAAPGQLEP
jgi:hypothetical protein